MNLADLGWCEFFSSAVPVGTEWEAARVAAVHRGGFEVWTIDAELMGEVSGRFRHRAKASSDYPAVGDWVLIERIPNEERALIHEVLPRRTKFSRTTAGRTTEEQVVAANIDTVFIVCALGLDVNLRRIERYLTLAWESGANPAILLTKTDLCEDLAGAILETEAISCGARVLAVSSISGEGVREVAEIFAPGTTATLLGPSGVGKSTLINALCGEELLDVQPVRETDQKGRHTTTHRQMIRLPNGGLIIDTPGMRELQLWEGESGIAESFADIDELAIRCRFGDCQHESEPGCAIRSAVAAGELTSQRLESYQKLKRELRHFVARNDARAQAESRRKTKILTKGLRERLREKGRES